MSTVVKDIVVEGAKSPLALYLHIVTELGVTAADARRRVNRQVVSELGTGLIGRDPDLVVDEKILQWRVPIILSLPGLGDLGQVGHVSVDAHTGDVHCNQEQQKEMVQHARRLYTGATHPRGTLCPGGLRASGTQPPNEKVSGSELTLETLPFVNGKPHVERNHERRYG